MVPFFKKNVLLPLVTTVCSDRLAMRTSALGLLLVLAARISSGAGAHSRALGVRRAQISRARPAWSAVPHIDSSPADPACENRGVEAATGHARAARTAEALWNFTRPHTLIGSALCIPALHLFAAPAGVALPWPLLLRSIGFVLVPSLLINVYIVGLNQVRRAPPCPPVAP